MIQQLIKYRGLLAAVMILSPLLFLFLHSELGLLTRSEDKHVSHDYCEIVKNSIVQKSNISKTDLPELNTITLPYNHCFEAHRPVNLFIPSSESRDHHYPHKSTGIYLYTKIFII